MKGANVKVYSKANDGNLSVAKNFKVREFACQDGTDTVFISPDLAALLQKIRDHFGAPVNINSGYRTEAHNKKVGGAAYSKHKYGMAADIRINGVSPLTIAKYACSIGAGGVGLYQSFTHIDVRPNKTRWDQRSGKQVIVTGF